MSLPAIGPLCMDCRHIRADFTCAAFPEGMPPIIAIDGHDHTTPVEGDQGITFEARSPDEPGPQFEAIELEALPVRSGLPDKPIPE